jgi:hypothetical protein
LRGHSPRNDGINDDDTHALKSPLGDLGVLYIEKYFLIYARARKNVCVCVCVCVFNKISGTTKYLLVKIVNSSIFFWLIVIFVFIVLKLFISDKNSHLFLINDKSHVFFTKLFFQADNFYGYEKGFDKIWQDLGRLYMES